MLSVSKTFLEKHQSQIRHWQKGGGSLVHAAICFGMGAQRVALTERLSRCGWTTRSDLCPGVTKLLHTTATNVTLTKP